MTSKVLVKMPEVPFSQVNNVKKTAGDLVPAVSSSNELRSINQLQDNIRFLQTKHQIMLTRLHDEVDLLRQKNRDLQFQLVFSKIIPPSNPLTTSVSTESASEVKVSPTESEVTTPPKESGDAEIYRKRCLQLEKELATTKQALETSLARNSALQALLQQHKIQEAPWLSQQCGRAAALGEGRGSIDHLGDGGEEAVRLQARLEDAERLVKRLRAETDEQRREVLAPAVQPQRVTSHGVTNLLFDSSPAPIALRYLQSIKASLSAGGRGNGGGKGGGNHRIGSVHHRFPPLQSGQPMWQQHIPQQQRENNDYQVWNRGNRRMNDKDPGVQNVGASAALPDLRTVNHQSGYNGNGGGQPRRGMGNHGYNNHYYRNSDRGHRGYREDDQQHKNYNTPVELSEGEPESSVDNSRNNVYKNKRGQNKHQDKS